MNREEAEQKSKRAELSITSGELDRAIEIYLELEDDRPRDGHWAHELADVHRRRGDRAEEASALVRAADRYRQSGALLASLVMVKRLLDLAPSSPDTQRVVTALFPLLKARPSPALDRPRTQDLELTPDGWASLGAPLAALSLARNVSGSSPEQPAWPAEIPVVTEIIHGLSEEVLLESTAPAMPTDAAASEPADTAWLLRFTPLFSALSDDVFTRLVRDARIVELSEGEVLFRQGSKGAAIYIVCLGRVSVTKAAPGRSTDVELATLDEGEFFGELSLVTEHPRSATVTAKARTQLLEIDREFVRALIVEDPGVMPVLLWFLRDRLVDALVRTHPLFTQFPYEQRRALAERFRFLEADRDIALIEQGKRSRGLIIVLAGRLEVLRSVEGRFVKLAELGPGDLVGEMSLLSWEPAIASVTSRGRFIGLFIPADEFQPLVTANPVLARHLELIAEQRRQSLVEALDADGLLDGALPVL